MSDETESKAVQAFRDQFSREAFRWFFEDEKFTDEDLLEARHIWERCKRLIDLAASISRLGERWLRTLSGCDLRELDECPFLSDKERELVQAARREFSGIRRESERRSFRQGFIYLALNKRNGFIKIGFSTQPATREATLQSEEPEIEFIHIAKGSMRDEQDLHRRFENKRMRGEWFELSEDDIAQIKSGE
jgi:hypothetical protein